jgi:hypothetical protein
MKARAIATIGDPLSATGGAALPRRPVQRSPKLPTEEAADGRSAVESSAVPSDDSVCCTVRSTATATRTVCASPGPGAPPQTARNAAPQDPWAPCGTVVATYRTAVTAAAPAVGSCPAPIASLQIFRHAAALARTIEGEPEVIATRGTPAAPVRGACARSAPTASPLASHPSAHEMPRAADGISVVTSPAADTGPALCASAAAVVPGACPVPATPPRSVHQTALRGPFADYCGNVATDMLSRETLLSLSNIERHLSISRGQLNAVVEAAASAEREQASLRASGSAVHLLLELRFPVTAVVAEGPFQQQQATRTAAPQAAALPLEEHRHDVAPRYAVQPVVSETMHIICSPADGDKGDELNDCRQYLCAALAAWRSVTAKHESACPRPMDPEPDLEPWQRRLVNEKVELPSWLTS